MSVERTGWAVVGVLWFAVAAAPAGEAPDAAALVRQVREHEAWVDRVTSLRIKADDHWVRSPLGIEKRKKELQAQFPEMDVSGFRDLKPEGDQRVEIAFDRSRARVQLTTLGVDDDLRVWDGARFILANHYDYAPERDGYLINREPKEWLFRFLWTSFASFRAGPHAFWWLGEKDVAEGTQFEGRPEDFVYGGQTEFHRTRCHVVNFRRSWTSLFIGAADGGLLGIRSGALANAKSQAFSRSGAKVEAMHRLIDACFEFALADEKEVSPGCWLPMTQKAVTLATDDDGTPFADLTRTIKITEATVNQPLPDTLFTVALKEGVWVNDQTHNPPLRYRHKTVMPAEEWTKIIAAGRARAKENQAHEQQ